MKVNQHQELYLYFSFFIKNIFFYFLYIIEIYTGNVKSIYFNDKIIV